MHTITFWDFNWSLFFSLQVGQDVFFSLIKHIWKKRFIKLWFLYETIDWLIQLDPTDWPVEPNDWTFTLLRFKSTAFTKYRYFKAWQGKSVLFHQIFSKRCYPPIFYEYGKHVWPTLLGSDKYARPTLLWTWLSCQVYAL